MRPGAPIPAIAKSSSRMHIASIIDPKWRALVTIPRGPCRKATPPYPHDVAAAFVLPPTEASLHTTFDAGTHVRESKRAAGTSQPEFLYLLLPCFQDAARLSHSFGKRRSKRTVEGTKRSFR